MTQITASRDYFFEFSGMPKSGKTTILDIVTHYLKRSGLRMQEFHGGGRYAPIDKSAIGSLNMYLAGMSIEFILVASEREKIGHRIFLLDRGIFDRIIFTRTLRKLKRIDDNEAVALEHYLKLPSLLGRLDAVFLFITNPDLSVSREYKNKLVRSTGRVMNTKFLESLRASAVELAAELKDEVKTLLLIDTEQLDGQIEETARRVSETMVEIIG